MKRARANQLLSSLLGAGGIAVSQRVLQFAISILLARALGIEGFGAYSYALVLITLLAALSQFGLPALVVREVASYAATGDFMLAKGVLVYCARAAAQLSLPITLIAAFLAWAFPALLPALETRTLICGLLLVPITAVSSISNAAISGFGYVVTAQFIDQFLRPLVLAAALGVLVTLQLDLEPRVAMALNVTAAMVATVFSAILLLRIAAGPFKFVNYSLERFSWRRNILPFGSLAVVQILNNQTDILLLGIFGTAADVGLFRVASQLALLVPFTLMIVNSVIAPRLADLYARGETRSLQRLITSTSQLALATALPIALAFLTLGEPILRSIFGEEYGRASTALLILAGGQIVNVGLGSVALILNMTGHEKDCLYGMSAGAVVNVILNLVLIPLLGITGAALGTALSIVAWNVLLAVQLHHRTGLISAPLWPRLSLRSLR